MDTVRASEATLVPHTLYSGRRVIRQLVEAVKELPGILRGLSVVAKPFRKQLLVVAIFNMFIASWSLLQPLLLTWSIDTFVEGAPYIEIVAIIIYPFLMITLPHGIVLPFFRDWYTMWYLRPQFMRDVSLRSVLKDREDRSRWIGKADRGPSLQEGRDAAYQVIEFSVREPFHIIKGFIIGTGLCFSISPVLMGLVALGICIDIFIMIKMRARLVLPISQMQDLEYSVKGYENQILDRKEGDTPVSYQEYSKEWDDYLISIRKAELPRMIYQTVWRGGASQLIRISILLLVGWWVHTGQISIGHYFYLTTLAMIANDPFEIFLNFMWKLVTLREQLRRFGILCGIDLGLLPPTYEQR